MHYIRSVKYSVVCVCCKRKATVRRDWNDAGNRTATSVLEKRQERLRDGYDSTPNPAYSCLCCSAQRQTVTWLLYRVLYSLVAGCSLPFRSRSPHNAKHFTSIMQCIYMLTCGHGRLSQAVYMHADLCSVRN